MLPGLEQAVERIRKKHFAFPAVESDKLAAARLCGVPKELLAFYGLCDGALIGNGDDFADPNGRRYRLKIPRLSDLQTAQSQGYIFHSSPLFDVSGKWWQILDYGDANWLAFDASFDSHCIIDVFHETAGEPDTHAIVANSMVDLLDRLLRRDGVYWFDKDFESLGSV